MLIYKSLLFTARFEMCFTVFSAIVLTRASTLEKLWTTLNTELPFKWKLLKCSSVLWCCLLFERQNISQLFMTFAES